MDPIDKLAQLFEKFPGTGPRQARRFVYHLLRQNPSDRRDMADAIKTLSDHVALCKESYQYFHTTDPSETLSPIARDPSRRRDILMIVEKDADISALERGGFDGQYFVLGGRVPVLKNDPEKYIRLRELSQRVKNGIKADNLKEIVIATSVTPEGENTEEHVRSTLSKVSDTLSITTLGRGLSTGSELEYMDPDTIKNALKGRH